MTPKEKAKQLVDVYFYNIIDGTGTFILGFNSAKQCALICCDEVLGHMGADRGFEFWQEVKQEIEAL